GVPAGDEFLHSSAPGCADRRTLVHAGSEPSPPLEIRLERAARLTVRLLRSSEGAPPLSDVDVRVAGVEDAGGRRLDRVEFTARRGADGCAEFLQLPSEELRVVVGDPRHPAVERALRLDAGEAATLELRVDHLAAIEAKVPPPAGGDAARRRVLCIGP